ncbi:MAG: ScyD/ScyE family protein [Verrucomicrobiota bacterium]|nr:ScyD/ScyE family protein [Verrucomicrobiota bacterium]
MNLQRFAPFTAAILILLSGRAGAQCTQVATGLHEALGTALTNQGNVLVAESGTAAARSGRISIVDMNGNRRTLIDGLPSGPSDVGDPSGPNGVFMRGRSLYVAIGVGDVGVSGPFPGTTVPNPNGPSSQLFSSILLVQFSAAFEQSTTGVTLTPAMEQMLVSGQTVWLTNDNREWMSVRMLVNFPDYVAAPLPTFAGNVQSSNPFDLVAVEDTLYVTDGGRNRLWQVDLLTGSFSTLAVFPDIPNPLFGGGPGGPFEQAVPTGIAAFRGHLFVTLFRGAPFLGGTSTVVDVNPVTGSVTNFITGRKTAIDVLPIAERGRTTYFVLQFDSTPGPFFGGPGQLLRFDSPTGPPTVLADCLTAPTSMTLDSKRGALYISEVGGRIVRIALPSDVTFTPTLQTLSTRGRVDSGDNLMIGGFTVAASSSGAPTTVLVRGIGPSLSSYGVAQPLADPLLTVHDATGKEIARNDNWRGDPGQVSQQAEIQTAGLAPASDLESAIVASLAPGDYTAAVRAKGSNAGNALVQVYQLP